MIKFSTSSFLFAILISLYLMGQLIRLDKSVFRKISSKMILVQGHSCFYNKCLFEALFDSFLLLESNDELSNQLTGPLGTNIGKFFCPDQVDLSGSDPQIP